MSKRHTSRTGRVTGGQPFSRGALFHLLRNRLYLGEIRHRDTHHPGLHPAIIDRDLFNAVQERLDGNARQRGAARESIAHSPLTGRIVDADCQAMSPTFAYGKGGKLYRYYVSASLQQGLCRGPGDTSPCRVSAPALEDALSAALQRLFPDRSGIDSEPLTALLRVEVRREGVELLLPGAMLRGIDARLARGEAAVLDPANPGQMRLTLPLRFLTGSGRTEVLGASPHHRTADPILAAALRAAHRMLSRDHRGRPCLDASPDTSHRRKLVRLAFLAPDLQRAILAGEQPDNLTLATLMEADIPLTWTAQRRFVETLAFSPRRRAG